MEWSFGVLFTVLNEMRLQPDLVEVSFSAERAIYGVGDYLIWRATTSDGVLADARTRVFWPYASILGILAAVGAIGMGFHSVAFLIAARAETYASI